MGVANKFENLIYTLRIPDDKIAKISDRYKRYYVAFAQDFHFNKLIKFF